MKRYLFFLSLLFPLVSSAQSSLDNKQQDPLGQGRLHIGVNVGGSYGGHLGATSFVTPRLQYFLTDGWSIAAEGRYVKTGSYFTYSGAGLSTRYYFLRKTQFALFGQIGATYGQRTYSRVEPSNPYQTLSGLKLNTWQANAGLGAHYRLGNRWSVEATVERSQFPKAYLSPDYSNWQGSLGINFRLK